MKSKNLNRLVMLLIVALLSVLSASAYDIEVDGIYYNIFASTKTANVTNGSTKYVGDVIVPASIKYGNYELDVVKIEPMAFFESTTLTSVKLPESITEIGDQAFNGCTSLISIELPKSSINIGVGVFLECSSLTSIKLPDSTSSISDYLFYGCSSLASIELPTHLEKIGKYAFCKCNSLYSIKLPSSLTIIDDNAFYGCSSITEIDLPSGLTHIGSRAFAGCRSLQQIVLPYGITKLEDDTFNGCSSLTEIWLSTEPTRIGNNALLGCSSLVKIGNMSSAIYDDPDIFWSCENLNEIIVGKEQHEFPIRFNPRNYYGSLDSEVSYYEHPSIIKDHLQNVKQIIIENSDKDFSINISYRLTDEGFNYFPVFSKNDLDYFYVGRPLINIKSARTRDNYTVSVGVKQGYGHIKTLEIGGQCTDVPYFYQKIDTLKLGKNTATFNMSNIYFDELSTIICKSEIPPATSNANKIASSSYLKTKILVPPGCKDVYAKSSGWENFWNIEESKELSGVDSASDSIEKTIIGCYDISGKSVDENYRGMVIVRFSDGSTKKIFQ